MRIELNELNGRYGPRDGGYRYCIVLVVRTIRVTITTRSVFRLRVWGGVARVTYKLLGEVITVLLIKSESELFSFLTLGFHSAVHSL